MAELVTHALSGGLSAFSSSSVLHPLEAVRTKLQALPEAKTIWVFIKDLYEKEGLAGFYAGFSAQVLTNVVNYDLLPPLPSLPAHLLIRRSKPHGSSQGQYAGWNGLHSIQHAYVGDQ